MNLNTVKERIIRYFRGRKPGWWISNTLFVGVILIFLIPSWRVAALELMLRMNLRTPDIETTLEHTSLSPDEQALQFVDLNGEVTSLAELKGHKPVFINVWATWCTHCIAEMGTIEDLYNEHGKNVAFVMLAYDEEQKVRNFAASKDYDLPFYLPYTNPSGIFRVSSYPTTYVLSKEGDLVLEHKGSANWDHDDVHDLLTELSQ